MFTRFTSAAHLVGYMDDTIVADEFVKSINEISRRAAELLGKPYGLQAAGGTRQDGESDEFAFANMLDDLRESVARADAFTSAVGSLFHEMI